MPQPTDPDVADFLRRVDRRRANTALFKATPGNLPAGMSFSRSVPAYQVDANGIYQVAGANVLRNAHYIGGVQTILLEGQRQNVALWSHDLTNAAWFKAGTVSQAQTLTGLDGTANSGTVVGDADAASNASFQQGWNVPVDSNTHTLALWVRKDTDQTRFPALDLKISGGTTVQRIVFLNTQTGAATASTITGTGTHRVVDAGLWWVLEITLTNNSTALNTTLTMTFYPAGGTVFGTFAAATTGTVGIGQVQTELNAPFYSSPIFTTGAVQTRTADDFRFTTNTTDPFTLYIKQVDLGSAASVGGTRIASMVTGSGHALGVYRNGSTATAAQFVDGAANPAVSTGPTTVTGDTVEYRLTLVARQFQLFASDNGAAEVGSTLSATAADATPFVRLDVNHTNGATVGFAAFQSVKIAAGVRSLAEMRNL